VAYSKFKIVFAEKACSEARDIFTETHKIIFIAAVKNPKRAKMNRSFEGKRRKCKCFVHLTGINGSSIIIVKKKKTRPVAETRHKS
jgi:hypothetical protein